MKCNICRQEITADCDYKQGRCPHRKPMIEIQPRDTSKGHFYVSLVKSFLRIAAGFALIMAGQDPALLATWLTTAGGLFIVAELLGILEELV